MSYIYPPTPAAIFSFFLESQAFFTPEPNFVFKCEYLKLEAYGKVRGNVKSLRKSCTKPLKYNFGGYDLGQRVKSVMSLLP
jgi:hypothetical protein